MLPCTLQYKVLLLTSPCNTDQLCSTLCAMVTPHTLTSGPSHSQVQPGTNYIFLLHQN